MRVSFYTVRSNLKTDNGYGYAGHNIRNSLEKLGHTVNFHDEQADVQLDFCQPPLYAHFPRQYKIGYTPWESTSLPEGWLEGFSSVDEVWTTSQKCKEWYVDAGVSKPIHVFEHGIEGIWSPKKRNVHNKLKFLHIGEPAPRKGGQMALEAFRLAFGNQDDVHLTIKSNGESSVRVYASSFHRGGPRSILGLPHQVYQNVTVMTESLSLEELVGLYHSHHALVYPSWGEGFGLIPLQGLATGMPTVCTGAWAPYQRFLGDLSLDSRLADSKWSGIHPGKMYEPSLDHLVELYRNIYENYSELSNTFYNNSERVHSEYNWDTLTKNAFEHLENR
ncbi:glycosyltransferase [Streptomyces phage Emma1919]|uniref:Glycosyltransferase n=2 Tax=Gilsonvirus gilson TaxID=2846398 RepID=A0A3T0ICI8_9CAUD|nr:glycosyltransferase [Streptomyces phage Gilson]QQV92389.1 glycosyltransferase [Streptomyces phage MeganTheeKilla]QZE11159.1 glycosyltransferase [Streptomyces phage Forrest]QZE11386.1 glycosyltransferase [Streptomyces phage Jada]URQ04636.1 glycosyltransferase [Streptomyces phage Emma1919]AZU97100.1 glycosyltransferase [Streptomyces phage Gilson]